MIRGTTVRAATLAALLLSAGCSGGGKTTTGDPCAWDALPNGLGCEFFPTVTANAVDGDFPFGVALVNPGTASTSVRIEGGALGAALEVVVPARSSLSRTLPWVSALKACTATGAACTAATGTSILVRGGAYHVTSTQPIAAYQFSPMPGSVDPGSGDATALKPLHKIGTNVVAAAWPAQAVGPDIYPGFVAITGIEDVTTVRIVAPTAVQAGDLPALEAGVETTVTLNRGDVLELLAFEGDLTGTYVDANAPVQVLGGHFCASVPAGVPYCDHLEEVMPSVSGTGWEYVLAPPVAAATPFAKPVIVRLVGQFDGTALTYSRAAGGAPATLDAFQFAEFELDAPLRFEATDPVLVAQYMEGYSAGGGDPSLVVAPAVSRWRTSYAIEVPGSGGGYADVIAPLGASVSLDGGTALQLEPISGTTYGLVRIGLAGTHQLAGTDPFSVSVYGYLGASSYWYVPSYAR